MENQTSLFVNGQGDGWYSRNKEAIVFDKVTKDVSRIYEELSPFKGEINSILEIGCANGYKLRSLCNLFEASGRGIEPSSKAVSEGNEHLKNTSLDIELVTGTADKLPFQENQFDLVYFGFCLYLVDRNDLLKIASEAERVLKPGGFLAILDFDPLVRHRRPYHHKESVFSYKQQHSEIFLSLGHYHLVFKSSLSHQGNFFAKDKDERISLSILFKETDSF